MGNKQLRPDPTDPFAPFGDDQKAYLKQKYDVLCDQKTSKLSSQKIVQQLRTTKEVAQSILDYIDFEGKGEVDFYEFMCAAASLHQDDEEAQQFLFDLFKANQRELNRDSFKSFFSTVFNYLKFMDLIKQEYDDKIGEQKFKQYDYNKNESIGLDEFRSLLVNDYHCSLWMQTLGFAAEKEVERKEKPINHEVATEKDEFVEEDDTGDQANSTPSWKGTIKYMSDQPVVKRSSPPNQRLDMDYIYGYRSYDTRSNLRYNRNNEVIYHTAACGIILNKLKKTQKFNTQHNDDITCLDINSKKHLVATGQMGRKPAIVVWDANTAETKAVFQNKLEHSIGCIAISPSGRYVAASSMSDNHEIAVYDINEKALVAYGKGPRSVIYQIKFNSEQDQVICACAKEVVFAYFSKGKLECKKGVFGKAPCLPCYSIAPLKNNECIISMQNGLLTLWKGNSCSKLFKEHSKAVVSIAQRQTGGIVSGDADGNIILWSSQMVVQKSFDLKKLYKSNNPRVISVFEQFGNILIGTRGGQIIEIQIEKNNFKLLMQGHFDDQLWGLAVSNSKHEFFTGGQDKLLMKWDIIQKKCIEKKKLDGPINCLDLSRNNQLAVGMKNGVVNIFQGSNLKLVKSFFKHKNPDKDMISAVKFSPDGTKLAVAYAPPYSCIYVYDLNEADPKPKCLSGSPSRINSIDFSRNGQAILVNNTSYEILFYDATSSQQKKAMTASNFKGEEWATLTARFSWATQGIWPPCSDGSDINTVDRSNSKKYIATGDDFSKVKIFDNPVCQDKQIYNSYKGHSSHITGVKWSFDDKYLISTGGLEKSIIQWSNTNEEEINYDYEDVPEEMEKKPVENAENEDDYEYTQLDDYKEQQPKKSKKKIQDEEDGDFAQDSDDEGDQSLAVKPFLGQVKASTPAQYSVAKGQNLAPTQDLSIKHVWGIRNLYISDRVRNQLRYSADYKSCLFITAALGVQMNLLTKEQTFYKGQSDDLISFAISKDRKYCATGQMAELNKKSPKNKILEVHVWDVETKTKLKVLSKFHQRAIYLVSFSPSGQKLLTIGQDDKNSLAVYDWKNQRIAFSAAVDGAKVCDAVWANQTQFLTCGLKHVKFWNGAKGTMGKISGNGGKWDPMLSAIYWNNKFVTGGTSGTVYLWSGANGTPCVWHKSRVDSFGIDHSGNLYSGDSQGKIISWKLAGGKLVMERQIFNAAQIDKIDPGILSIDFSPQKNMLICTNSSSIYEVSGKQTKTIMKSHCKGELWAEAWSPDSKKFVTGGDDNTLRIFDAFTYEELHCYKMKEPIRGVDWQQSSGQLIVAGDYRGGIYLFNASLELLSDEKFKTLFKKTKPKQEPYWIEDIKFSPNGQCVAFGAHGGPSHIEVYDIEDGKSFKNQRKITGLFSSALLSLDWDQGSQIIAGVSLAYELNFANAQTKQKVNASSVKNTKWATWSSKFGYQAKQVHQDVDYSNVNAVCVNPSKTLVATGGDDQKVRLFKYPVIIPKQKSKEFTGQSSHVTKVRFSPDENFLLSIGGNDRTTILWELKGVKKVVKKDVEEDEEEAQEEVQAAGDDEENQDEDGFDEIRVPRGKQPKAKPVAVKKQSDDFEQDEDDGDQFMAVKPWIGAIKEPTGPYYKSTGTPPPITLDIEFAHGYRTKDCRNNLRYVDGSLIAYHTAGLGVIMDTKDRAQAFFDGHKDDVISFYQHKKNRSVVYTSEMGDKSTVFAWKAETGEQPEMIKEFKGARKGLSAVIGNGTYVVAACLDDNHEIYLWNYQTGKLIKNEKGGREVIIGMDWVSQTEFVTVGVKHYKLWKVDPLKGQPGSFGSNNNILCCVATKDGKIYAGASDGGLQIWSGKACSKSIPLHNKAPLNALWVGNDILMTGGGDKTVCILKQDSLEVIQKFNCESIITDSVKLSICSLDVWQNKILLGTLGSEIYELKAATQIEGIDQNTKISLVKKLMSGHYAPNKVTNEVWGLSLYQDQSYLTCSDDGTVRIWDIETREERDRFSLNVGKEAIGQSKDKLDNKQAKVLLDSAKGRCICSNQEGWIVVGCKDGTVKIFDDEFTLRFVGKMNDKKKEISQVKFSPDGRLLAVGDHLGFIYVYIWNGGQIKKKHSKIKHNSYIKHLDFSKDSNTIHSTCGAYQLLFWDAATGSQKKSGATETKNEDWATWSTTLGWPVQGVFKSGWDGTDINAVDRSNDDHCKPMMKLLASADDEGKVRVLEYPCTIANSKSVEGKGHSSHVTNVRFTRNDKFILSTGGEDQTVIQWKCETDEN